MGAGVEEEVEAGLAAMLRSEGFGADRDSADREDEAGLAAGGVDPGIAGAEDAQRRIVGRTAKSDPDVSGRGFAARLAEIGAVARAPGDFLRSLASAGSQGQDRGQGQGQGQDRGRGGRRGEAAAAGQPLILSRGWPLATPPLSSATWG